MQDRCINDDFFKVQSQVLRKSIEEDKWYLSEQEGRDVGWDAAEQHFISTYFCGFAAGFKAAFCSMICPNRKNCQQAQQWLPNCS